MARELPPLTQPNTPTSTVKRFYFCRHGETGPNSLGVLQGSGIDEFLNDRGVFQAQCLRDRLDNVKIDLIVSSHLKRAKQTAEIVREKHQETPFVQDPELAEISWGDWEGATSPLLPKLLEDWESGNFGANPPNGESPLQVEARAMPALYKYLDRPEETILFVLHGRLLRILLSSFIYRNLEHMSAFTHHNTCLNLIDVIIESDQSKFSDDPLHGCTVQETHVLDDNVSVDPLKVHPRVHMPVQSTLVHPRNLTLLPLLLDDRSHLPPEMRQ
ncbi:histidine phosphatase superfamily [Gorgonomyces haynaldii]|nr:histidine phosphatase superfamily [Gorgonomyces haynaldii]